jgi:hypothetical protein
MSRRALFLALTVVSAALITFLASSPPADAILLQGTFIDDNDSVHQNGIEAIAAAGITVGCNPPTNDRFCPNDSVTRAQAATFLARALSLPDDGNDYFVDDNGHVLEGGINRVAAAGITAGCNPPDNDRFCPDRALTRAQFAAFITRALGLPTPASITSTTTTDMSSKTPSTPSPKKGSPKGAIPPPTIGSAPIRR